MLEHGCCTLDSRLYIGQGPPDDAMLKPGKSQGCCYDKKVLDSGSCRRDVFNLVSSEIWLTTSQHANMEMALLHIQIWILY